MTQLNHPDNLLYAKTHEWARIEGDEAVIGISDYAQDVLGEVVSIDLPWNDAGKRDAVAGRHIGDIDSVKATSELFAPLSGQIVKINQDLQTAAEVINTDPYGDGWLMVIKLSAPEETAQLMNSAQYVEFLSTQTH